MAKVRGFWDQDVKVERKETPDSPPAEVFLPPEFKAMLDRIIRYFDNQVYPTFGASFLGLSRGNKEQARKNTFLPEIKGLWAGLSDEVKANWKSAAAFVKHSGWQLFVKDTSLRKKSRLAYPRSPSEFFPMFGLLMGNLDGSGDVCLRRDNPEVTGQVTLSFNYKKIEYVPTGGDPFKVVVTLYYFDEGQNKTETHTWEAPAGNVDWDSVEETYGTEGRRYFHHVVEFHLTDYCADVFLANFLIQDQTLAWTVDYPATKLPEAANPPWVKTGGVSTEEIRGSRLLLASPADVLNSVKYTRTPEFSNGLGSTVQFRICVKEGTEKDAGNDQFVTRVTHCDGTRKAEYLFYTNGIILKLGDEYTKYHFDTRAFHTYSSFIKQNRLYFYVAKTLAFRKSLSTSGGQEVSFEHHGRALHDTESWWSFLRYFQGRDTAPGEDVHREGWWVPSNEVWKPDLLVRKTGWSFSPEYAIPYFKVVYLC